MALLNTVTGIFDATYTGWSPYFWYFIDWCLVLTIVTQWGVVVVHFFPFHHGLSRAVNFMFQVVLPMTCAITLLYWVFFYQSGSMHADSTSTYVHPVFLYIVPALLLVVEWCLNSIFYQYKYVLYMLAIYCVYMPMTYIGKFVLGYFPYPFITWDTLYSYVMLLFLGLLQVACFYGVAYTNNTLKRKYLDNLAEKESILNLDRGIYNEVQMNMFKSTITPGEVKANNRYQQEGRGSSGGEVQLKKRLL